MSKEKPYNGGTWTEARMRSFIMSALRGASQRWAPKASVLKHNRCERGVYRCEGFRRRSHKVPVSIKVGSKRQRNVFVDHIEPVINPEVGFVSWDEVIKRMFVETEGFQVLCSSCHSRKTAEERSIRNAEKTRRK